MRLLRCFAKFLALELLSASVCGDFLDFLVIFNKAARLRLEAHYCQRSAYLGKAANAHMHSNVASIIVRETTRRRRPIIHLYARMCAIANMLPCPILDADAMQKHTGKGKNFDNYRFVV